MHYIVNIFNNSPVSGNIVSGAGSFNNIAIDGRLSWDNAIEIARENAIKECTFKNKEYLGFAIKKINGGWDFKGCTLVDCPVDNAKDIKFLI